MDVSVIYGEWGYKLVQSYFPMEIVQVSLSAASIIAVALRMYCVKRLQPFLGAGLAALAYMIQSISYLGSDTDIDSYYVYGYFFESIISPILWCIAFDRIRVASNGNCMEKLISCDLLGVKLGYLWTILIIITTTGVTIAMGTFPAVSDFPRMRPVFDGILLFIANAPWGYSIFLLGQLACNRSCIQHFRYSFFVYITLLVIINCGATMNAFYAYFDSEPIYVRPYPYDDLPSVPAMITAYVLIRYIGIFAIVLIVARGHDWRPSREIYIGPEDIVRVENSSKNATTPDEGIVVV